MRLNQADARCNHLAALHRVQLQWAYVGRLTTTSTLHWWWESPASAASILRRRGEALRPSTLHTACTSHYHHHLPKEHTASVGMVIPTETERGSCALTIFALTPPHSQNVNVCCTLTLRPLQSLRRRWAPHQSCGCPSHPSRPPFVSLSSSPWCTTMGKTNRSSQQC